MDFKDKVRVWLDDARYEIKKFFKRKVKRDEDEALYETRWVWYHSALVIELFIIIILLWYIAI
tara:strand:+ start:154 stop:342 length:189 start_codon:yes stop_codon:yes gene_type:complete